MQNDFTQLKRRYYFHESMAIYDSYYSNIGNEGNSETDARPLTWVPLLFHCTTWDNFQNIIRSGKIQIGKKKYISFTETPIDDLDRFKRLKRDGKKLEVAIGVPRSMLESVGLFQPLYLKHASQEIRDEFKNSIPKHLYPYIEFDDDLGALNEVRVTECVDIENMVWILTSRWNPKTESPIVSDDDNVLSIIEKMNIAKSFWHRTHQEGIVKENVYRRDGIKIESIGEHYFKKKEKKLKLEVMFPAGKKHFMSFPRYREDSDWDGPFTNIQMAKFFYNKIQKDFPDRLNEIKNRISYK